MTPEKLKRIAGQALEGKNLYQMDFGEPILTPEEKLALVDMALKRYTFSAPPQNNLRIADHVRGGASGRYH